MPLVWVDLEHILVLFRRGQGNSQHIEVLEEAHHYLRPV